MLVFYPADFSPVCTDQLSVYQEVLPRVRGAGASSSTASRWTTPSATTPSSEHLGISIPLLADFHPKGEVSGRYGVYAEEYGLAKRALVMIGPDLRSSGSTRRRRSRSPARTSSLTRWTSTPAA